MENLISRLQKEVGLTEEQAVETIKVLKDFMRKEGLSVDWDEFFKEKYDDFVKQTKVFMKDVSRKVDSFSDKLSDKTEDVAIQTKRAARDLSKRVYDRLNDEVK